jgi:hypothetical protein
LRGRLTFDKVDNEFSVKGMGNFVLIYFWWYYIYCQIEKTSSVGKPLTPIYSPRCKKGSAVKAHLVSTIRAQIRGTNHIRKSLDQGHLIGQRERPESCKCENLRDVLPTIQPVVQTMSDAFQSAVVSAELSLDV